MRLITDLTFFADSGIGGSADSIALADLLRLVSFSLVAFAVIDERRSVSAFLERLLVDLVGAVRRTGGDGSRELIFFLVASLRGFGDLALRITGDTRLRRRVVCEVSLISLFTKLVAVDFRSILKVRTGSSTRSDRRAPPLFDVVGEIKRSPIPVILGERTSLGDRNNCFKPVSCGECITTVEGTLYKRRKPDILGVFIDLGVLSSRLRPKVLGEC